MPIAENNKRKYLIEDVFDHRFAINFEKYDDHYRIEDFLSSRGISSIVHFTAEANLASILTYGLLPRDALPDHAIVSDQERYDAYTDCNCLSISFPNYAMFYKKRETMREYPFIILGFSLSIFFYFPLENIAYFPYNAATYKLRNKFKSFTGFDALKKLFSEEVNFYDKKYTRSSTNLPQEFPTDPQAELLINGCIPARFLSTIFVRTQDQKDRVLSILKQTDYSIPVEVRPEFYDSRFDYKFWKKPTQEESFYGY